jgi:hypothetical protein
MAPFPPINEFIEKFLKLIYINCDQHNQKFSISILNLKMLNFAILCLFEVTS